MPLLEGGIGEKKPIRIQRTNSMLNLPIARGT